MANFNPPIVNPWLSDLTQQFEDGYTGTSNGGESLKKRYDEAQQALAGGASDPATLAKYQAVAAEVQLFRNAQSSTVKMFKDVDMAIIQNFR